MSGDVAESTQDYPLPLYTALSADLNPKPFAGEGSEDGNELFKCVGLATSAFENIQDEMVQLFDQLCGGSFYQLSPMGEIIGATSSFNVKIDLVTQAAKSLLRDEQQQAAVLRWIRLATKASLIRNKIAHGRPINSHFVFKGESRRAVFWAPSLFDTRKGHAMRRKAAEWEFCWNGDQINQYVYTFSQVFTMLRLVREQLAGVNEEDFSRLLDPENM